MEVQAESPQTDAEDKPVALDGLGVLSGDQLYVEWQTFLYGLWQRIEYL